MLSVLHGPVNVGNQPWVLSRHERQLGWHSDLVVNYSTWFGYPCDTLLSALGKRTLGSMARRLLFGLTAAVERRPLISALAFSVGTALVAFLLFSWFLKSPLPRGPFGFF